MFGRVMCTLRLHSDERRRAQGGGDGWYARCRRCGRERDIPIMRISG